MFGWGTKKEPKPDDTRAYQLGADMGRQMAEAISEYLDARTKQLQDGYLSVLRDRFRLCFNHAEAPPIRMARIEYNIFCENVGELKDKLGPEITSALSDWLGAADEMGVRADVDQLIAQRIDDFSASLLLSGLEVMTNEYGAVLISADDAWRAKHPELAAQWPKD